MLTLASIIIDPVLTSQINLKQALRALPIFSDVVTVNSVAKAQTQRYTSWDILFLSERLNLQETLAYLRSIPSNKDQTGAFILVMASGQSEAELAQKISLGFDGVLCQPFSVEAINGCVEVALSIKAKGLKNRVKLGISLVLPMAIQELRVVRKPDDPASVQAVATHLQPLRDTCRSLKEVCDFQERSYPEIIEEIFAELSENAPGYSGASKRLRESASLEQTAYARLKAELILKP